MWKDFYSSAFRVQKNVQFYMQCRLSFLLLISKQIKSIINIEILRQKIVFNSCLEILHYESDNFEIGYF